MATRKFKSRPRKTVRRHRRSTSGRVKVPLDVRSQSDLPKFRQALKNKGLTIILVYADWCPHCHTLMPHFDAAAKSPNNTITPVKIEDTMVDSVNSYIKNNINQSAKPLSVKGYPSIILVNNKAEKITDIEPVRNTESLKKVMENAGPLANNAGITKNNSVNRNNEPTKVVNSIVETEVNIPKNNKNMLANIGVENKGMANGAKNIDVGEDELLGSIASEPNKPKNNSLKSMNMNKNVSTTNNKNKLNLEQATAPSPLNSFPEKNEKVNVKAPSLNNKEAEEMMSLQSPLEGNQEIKPVNPPSPIIEELEPAEKLSGGGRSRRGGSLMSAMARTTYALAPAAALLATAAMVMRRKTRKSSKKSKKSQRRRR